MTTGLLSWDEVFNAMVGHDKVRSKTAKWLESTNFIIDNNREMMGHMIYTGKSNEIYKGLGYEQLVLYGQLSYVNKFFVFLLT